jgi:hypothetical protein
MVQAQHIDCEFYDTHYQAGAYTDRHRRHVEKWHTRRARALRVA